MTEPSHKDVPGASPIRGFATKVCQYFLDFLATDFKKQQAPRRRIQHKTEAGYRAGFRLNPYQGLNKAVRDLLKKPVGTGLNLEIVRNAYKAPINPIVSDLIHRQVDAIERATWATVREDFLEAVKGDRALGNEDPEKYIGSVLAVLENSLTTHVVVPLLTTLDRTFQSQAYAAIESAFEVQTDLVADLCNLIREQMPARLNEYVVTGKIEAVTIVLDELFAEEEAETRIKAFFDGFATSDAFQELRDLMTYLRNGGENLQLYLYVGDLRMDQHYYPVAYIPVEVTIDEDHRKYMLAFPPHVLVHKYALDFFAQELQSNAALRSLVALDNRMIHVQEGRAFLDVIEPIISRVQSAFDLTGTVELDKPVQQEARSSRVRLTNTIHLAVCDRSDESVLNDYEELLRAFEKEGEAASQLFEDIIRGFLEENPAPVGKQVEKAWQGTPVTERLVAASPIPLNEEQRKLLSALKLWSIPVSYLPRSAWYGEVPHHHRHCL